MKLQRRFALSLALVTLLGFAASQASAQTGMRGTFVLPEQAYWNNTLLPAGQYTLAIQLAPVGVSIITVKGEGVSANFLAPASSDLDGSRATCLKLDSVNGAYVVRELDSRSLDRSYKFGVSKAARHMALNATAAPPVTVAVSGF